MDAESEESSRRRGAMVALNFSKLFAFSGSIRPFIFFIFAFIFVNVVSEEVNALGSAFLVLAKIDCISSDGRDFAHEFVVSFFRI